MSIIVSLCVGLVVGCGLTLALRWFQARRRRGDQAGGAGRSPIQASRSRWTAAPASNSTVCRVSACEIVPSVVVARRVSCRVSGSSSAV